MLDKYMAKYIKGETTQSIIVDPNASYTAFGTGNPLPVESVGGSVTKPIGSDSTINVIGGSIASPSTYTSNSERSYEPDVGMFFKADQAGVLKFQFSPDDSTWSTFPVNGFTIASGVWEFHTAVKLPRYFRWQFTPSSGTATFDAYVYYGTFRQGSAPLNQSISDDSDAQIVRAVTVGTEPNGSYANVKKDGSGFRTTANLAGTTLSVGFLAGYTGNITVGDTSSFAASGYVYIDSEFMAYTVTDGTQLNITARGQFGSTDANHSTAGVAVGEVYNSGILTLDGYTEVATKRLSSNNGQGRFRWFSDSAGTDVIRTLAPAYNKTQGYDYLAAPNFGPYVQYIHANTETTDTTDFYFETEFYTKAISAQVLSMNSTILGGMTANLGRNVICGQVNGGSFSNVGITSTRQGDQAVKVAVAEPLTAFGDLRTVQAEPEVQLSWVYGGVNPLLVNTDVSGGSLSAANSILTVGSGTGASDYGRMESRRYVKYRTGQGALFRGTCIFDSPVSGNTQLFGLGTDDNGYFFGYHDTCFGILRRDGGVDYWTYQDDWNDDKFKGTGDSGKTLNQQLGNVYQINYQWLGFGAIFFGIEAASNIQRCHTIEYANTATTPSIMQPALPIMIESRNTGNTSNIEMKSSSVAGFNQGSIADLGSTYSQESSAITAVTTERAVLSLKVNTTMNGIESYIPVVPLELSAAAEGTGNNPIKFGVYIDASLGGAPSWTNIDASFSTVSYDVAGTAVSNGTKIGSYVVERNRGLQVNMREKNITLGRGQILTVTASSASSCDPDVALVWIERDSG